ncbi:hypothetical protein DVH24_039353 [Malus domestica]|uniref:peroxidase n=1 Tax=Malus domestica TaxID=3750 RepID=A0A498HZX0_MALDO|nr:hypothetical protein DVH24_039353 [Malus domestica]
MQCNQRSVPSSNPPSSSSSFSPKPAASPPIVTDGNNDELTVWKRRSTNTKTPISEELQTRKASSFAQEPLVNLVSLASSDGGQDFFMEEMMMEGQSDLEYDFYRETCPEIETIVRSTMAQIYSHQKNVSAQLLRLIFHDCFIQF